MNKFSEEALQSYPFAGVPAPSRWEHVSLADISADVSPGFASGKHNSDGAGVPHLRPMNVDRDGQIDLSVVKSVAASNGVELKQGDVLFNNTNSAELIGKTAVVSRRESGFAFSNHMTRVRPEGGIDPVFVARQLHFLWMSGYLKHRCTNHVNQASISSKTLANTIPILLPPSAEQTRIVEKLEELLSDHDAGVAELKAAQKKLGQYRQSLLKAAVEGALTAEWRKQRQIAPLPNPSPARGEGLECETEAALAPLPPRGGGAGGEGETGTQLLARILTERRARWEAKQLAKFAEQGKAPPKDWQKKYPEPVQPDTSDLPKLTERWVWASLDMLIDDGPQNGLYLPRALYGSGVPMLRIDDYQIGWHRERSNLNLVDADACTTVLYSLHVGDLVINRVNSMSHIGKSLRINEALDGVLFESNMMRLRLSGHLSVDYVSLYLGSDLGRARLTQGAKWAVNQASINQQDAKRTPIPLPPQAEQMIIADELQTQLDAITSQTEAIEAGLKQSAAQRKNILRAAFSGQLVPQDPNDEPASVLLERIRAERVERDAVKKPRGRKAKELA